MTPTPDNALPPLRRGEFVRLQFGDQHANGMVAVASPNGQSVMVFFDAILDGCVGVMPLDFCTAKHAIGDPHYHNVITGNRIDLDRIPPPGAPVH